MAEKIEDIVKWIKSYYFLNEVWKKYDDFDKSLGNDIYNIKYISVCGPIMNKLRNHTDEDYNFCMKLVRNFGHFSDNHDFLHYKPQWCYDLNNWIYNSMVKHKIPKSIITDCFDEYDGTVKGMGQIPACVYYDYDNEYEDPMKIILLNIFVSNPHIFQTSLESEIDLIRCSCQEYVSKIVEIYKYMKKEHCSNDQIFPKTETCKLLDNFKLLYNQYLINEEKINKKIPSLENENLVIFTGCHSDKSPRRAEPAGSFEVHQSVDDDLEFKSAKVYNSPITSETTHGTSPMSRTVSTAIGTVAGTSSLLAMLYKFTPAKKILYSGFRGSGGHMHNNLYEYGPTELLPHAYQDEDMSSYNTSYNVGYGSA